MRTYIGDQEAVSTAEFEELALGFDVEDEPGSPYAELFRELFVGAASTAQLDAARDILADLREQAEAGDEIAALDAVYADQLMHTVPFLLLSAARTNCPATRSGAAA